MMRSARLTVSNRLHITRTTTKPAADAKSSTAGFSLLEIVVVVTILSIIASLAIPSILKLVYLSKIDAAKTLLNAAASECLQSVREGTSPSETSPKQTTISNENLESYGYKALQTDNKCASYIISPIREDESFLYTLGFKISTNGEIIKIAIPASDSGSLNSCKNWAGVNCGVSAEQQAVWDALAKIEKDKKTCNDDFYAWLQKPSSGSYNRWDESTKSCSLETWAFEGSIQKDESAVKSARAAKLGAACIAKLKEKETAKFDGVFTDSECGTTYFCSGKDLATDSQTAYSACKEEERVQKCTAALGDWKNSKANGKFEVDGCQAAWACGGTYYNTQTDYDKTTCACTWQKESYQTGTALEKYQCGEEIRERCTKKDPLTLKCKKSETIRTPKYCSREVPTFGQRDVCK